MKKILLAFVLFIIGIILFMPKENLLYTLETILKKEHLELRSDDIRDRLIDLDIKEPLILYDGIESLKANELVITPWILKNKIEATDVRVTKALERILNVKADRVVIDHSILDYKRAYIKASGDFGEISGSIDLGDKKIHLLLNPTKKFKNNQIVRDYFKKSKEGLVYESKF